MCLSLGVRPRSAEERLRLARALSAAPARVGLGFVDDGWVAAHLWVGGRVPVWLAATPPDAADTLLDRLGLPPVARGPCDAVLGPDLTWHSAAPPAGAPLPPVAGPLVTLLVCTYNRAGLLEGALRSACAQRWPHEVLVVDDGSTDETPAVLARLAADADLRALRVLRQEPNQGKPAALARGLAEARGEAILVLDDDDLLLPGALHVLGRALFADPARVAVWADTVVFDAATGAPTAVHPACRLPPAMVRRAALQQIPAMPGATLVRAAAWRAAGPLDPRLIRGQDMDLFLALSRQGPILGLPLQTFWYRCHDGLRGSAAGQWNKRDPAVHRARFLACVQPVFRDRWRALAPAAPRAEGFAWALGLQQRGLVAEGRVELTRWPAPFTPAEAWVRAQLGLAGQGETRGDPVVVVDDGDDGALEATLHAHAGDAPLWVSLEVPRDPLGNLRLYWPGAWAARETPATWVRAPGPWRLRLASAPGWAPPPVDPRLVPPFRGVDALYAVAAALDWPPPMRTRPGLPLGLGPEALRAVRAREALREGRPAAALGALAPLLEAHPGWPGGWRLAAEAFQAAGRPGEARECAARA